MHACLCVCMPKQAPSNEHIRWALCNCEQVDHCIVGWDSKVGAWSRMENYCVLGEDVQCKVRGCDACDHAAASFAVPSMCTCMRCCPYYRSVYDAGHIVRLWGVGVSGACVWCGARQVCVSLAWCLVISLETCTSCAPVKALHCIA